LKIQTPTAKWKQVYHFLAKEKVDEKVHYLDLGDKALDD
jgi:hypothetical protein